MRDKPASPALATRLIADQHAPKQRSITDVVRDNILTLTITTLTRQTFSVRAFPTDTVAELKDQIEADTGIPAQSQILIWHDTTLADSAMLFTIGLRSLDKLQLVVKMIGGPGHPGARPVVRDDERNVALFLCRHQEDVYILEIYLRTQYRRQHPFSFCGSIAVDALTPEAIFTEIDKTGTIRLKDIEKMAVDAIVSSSSASVSQDGGGASSRVSSASSVVSAASAASLPQSWCMTDDAPPPARSVSSLGQSLDSRTSIESSPLSNRPVSALACRRQSLGSNASPLGSRRSSRIIYDASNPSLNHLQCDNITSAFPSIPSRDALVPRPPPVNSHSPPPVEKLNTKSMHTLANAKSKTTLVLPPVRPPTHLPRPQSTKPSPPPAPLSNVCFQCHKKLTAAAMTAFKCRCGHAYCPTHRFPDRHSCPTTQKPLPK